ncbi:MAG: fimbrillin family protein [Muribaculaceae bacterium]|nr:fimbrillin family protein [Muribaculaceae bacterium]
MNDKRIKYIGLFFLSALLLSSCSKEDLVDRGMTDNDSEILFFTSMPGIETRSAADIDKNSIKNGFDVSAARLDSIIGKDTIPIEHFSAQRVFQTAGMGEAFRSDGCKWPSSKGKNAGKLRFYAFYPSRETLRDSAGVGRNDENYFKLEYAKTNGKTQYWMKRFKVNEDILSHSDFVTATVEGSKTDNLYSGVNLALQHQLSKLTLEAFGSSDSYDVEIAGVRIGGIALESDFNFEDKPLRVFNYTMTRVGKWTNINKTGCVEYIFHEKDTVITINKENTPDKSHTKSIMGHGGPALVIPHDYTVWKYGDNKTYQAQGSPLYFSVLLRVKEKLTPNHTLLYPYIEGASLNSSVTVTADNMKIVYLSVERTSGKVMKRVYMKDKKFYTSPDYSEGSLYTVPAEEEVRNYGWASCIPNTNGDPQMRWNPGFQYYYQLDYSKGIGVQDPADALPGKVIIYPIEVTASPATTWHTVKDYNNVEIKDGDVGFTIE